MNYTELTCFIASDDGMHEVLVALLGEEGFEMFEEFDGGVKAYIQTAAYDPSIGERLSMGMVLVGHHIRSESQSLADTNWNEVWESNFQPVLVGETLYVRAEYHPAAPEYPLELIVQPRMAFGTGHHATTFLMMEQLLLADLKGKSLLDMGCGTGILAILASKLGASPIKAVDIDPNSVENTGVNCQVNQTTDMVVEEGTMATISHQQYDVIVANINRNIILADLPLYADSLKPQGILFTSGFYFSDLPLVEQKAQGEGLKLNGSFVKDEWCCAVFKLV